MIVLLGGGFARAQNMGPGGPAMVTTETEAYAVLPPDLIAAPMVVHMATSTDGRYILVARTAVRITPKLVNEHLAGRFQGPPPGEMSLILWDNKTRAAKEIWKSDANTTQIATLDWLSGSEVGLALIRETIPPTPQKQQPQTRQGLLRISSLGTRPQVIGLTGLEDDGHLQLFFSPVEPLAILEHARYIPGEITLPDGNRRASLSVQRTLYLIRQDGRLGASLKLSEEMAGAEITWSQSGEPVLRTFVMVDKKPLPKWFAVDRRNFALKPLVDNPGRYQRQQPELAVRLRTTTMAAKEGSTTKPISVLWLEGAPKSEAPRALVTSDSSGGMVLPGAESIVYHSQGAVWSAQLLKMPKEVYLMARQAAERSRIISNAKQLGLAAIMYVQDYDENLPGPEGINGKLEPYLKNSSLFEGFNYTFGGGPLSGIDSPAETELGYVTGPGGRAIIYVDGHVNWKPD
jgi:hypothetical protein